MKSSPLSNLGFRFKTMAELSDSATVQYNYVKGNIDRKEFPFIKSCGTVIWATSNNLVAWDGITTGDCHEFNYTVKELVKVIEDLKSEDKLQYVKEIGLWGRIDGYVTPQDFKDGEYTPEIESWELDLWRQEDQQHRRRLVSVLMDA